MDGGGHGRAVGRARRVRATPSIAMGGRGLPWWLTVPRFQQASLRIRHSGIDIPVMFHVSKSAIKYSPVVRAQRWSMAAVCTLRFLRFLNPRGRRTNVQATTHPYNVGDVCAGGGFGRSGTVCAALHESDDHGHSDGPVSYTHLPYGMTNKIGG